MVRFLILLPNPVAILTILQDKNYMTSLRERLKRIQALQQEENKKAA